MIALTTAPTNRVREYETIYILRPDIDPDAADKVASRIAEVVTRENGKLVKVENWGRRKLAYDIAKHKRGVYTYVKFLGGGALVNELERNLRMLDTVIRYQTVLLRSDVVAETITIDPEETKFTRLELPPEDEKEDSRERLLGFLDDAPERPRRRDEEVPEDVETPEEEPTLNPDIAGGEEEKS